MLKVEKRVILGFTIFFLLNSLLAVSFAADDVIVENVELDEQFQISLDSNPSTGYSWEADYDPEYLELISEEYVPDNTGGIVLGGGGSEIFTFQALKVGQTTITFNYQMGSQPVDTLQYDIRITDTNNGSDNPRRQSTDSTIPMQNTGTPVNLLVLAVSLIGLGSWGIFKN